MWILPLNFISPKYVRFVRTFFNPFTESEKFFARELREYFLARNVLKREWTRTASSFGVRFPFITSYPSGGLVWSLPIVAIFSIPIFCLSPIFCPYFLKLSNVFQSIFSAM